MQILSLENVSDALNVEINHIRPGVTNLVLFCDMSSGLLSCRAKFTCI